MRVVVTGGRGFVGRRLQIVQPDWIYLSSKDFDLTEPDGCRALFAELKPDAVIHLAARTGGIKESSTHQAEFFYNNIITGANLVHAAYRAGVNRMLVALSTCAWPDVVPQYPFTEDDLFAGRPAETNIGYGEAKRGLYVQALTYRKQYGMDYSCFCPSNLYGPGDTFDPDRSHFVSALVRKVAEAKAGSTLEMWGTGKPLRQQLFVDDVCRAIPLLLEKHHSDVPIIVAPDENLSIAEMCDMLISQVNKDLHVVFNNKLDGQFRKDGSNRKLRELLGNFEFTPFRDGVKQTYDWYTKETSR